MPLVQEYIYPNPQCSNKTDYLIFATPPKEATPPRSNEPGNNFYLT